MDRGNIIAQKSTPIGSAERTSDLYERLKIMGAELLGDAIKQIAAGTVTFTKQNNSLASPAPKLKKEDGMIDWKLTAPEIVNRIRAFYPFPGSCTGCGNGRTLGITNARVVPIAHTCEPGTIISISETLLVAAGKDAVELIEVKPECKKAMKAQEFVCGSQHVKVGTKFQ